eukprot:3719016-Pleurochrysis_carterae.AAC.1
MVLRRCRPVGAPPACAGTLRRDRGSPRCTPRRRCSPDRRMARAACSPRTPRSASGPSPCVGRPSLRGRAP